MLNRVSRHVIRIRGTIIARAFAIHLLSLPPRESEEKDSYLARQRRAAVGRNIGARNTHASRLGTERKEQKKEREAGQEGGVP